MQEKIELLERYMKVLEEQETKELHKEVSLLKEIVKDLKELEEHKLSFKK